MYWTKKLNKEHTGLASWLTPDEMNYLRRQLRRWSPSINRAIKWREPRSTEQPLAEAINRLTILTGP